jgi:glycine betaine/proline transport system substrate-binding protein
VQECANIGKLLTNLEFSLAMENEVMGAILDDNQKPRVAARSWLQKNPEVLDAWLDGVQTKDGQPGLAAVRTSLGL